MSEEQWYAVDQYITDLLVPQDAALSAALADSAAQGLPQINVAPNQGKLLHMLARIHGASSVLEVGTLGGYSTIWLARALPKDGRLITLEASDKHAGVAARNIERAGLADLVDIRLGDARDTLRDLVEEGAGPFDLVFIDADKANIPTYFSWALRLTRRGSLIIVDNVVRGGAVADEQTADPHVQGVRRFMDMLATERRVQATAVQTVGSKGYDGFAVVLVTGE